MEATQATPALVDVTFTNWEGTKHTDLNGVSRDATVAEVASEAVKLMGLPLKTFYQALFKGRQLNPSDTIEEAGIRPDEAVELIPNVKAG
jgi:hypothetical protein